MDGPGVCVEAVIGRRGRAHVRAARAHVYNPLTCARRPHEAYLQRYGAGTGRVLLVGMNPGPFGMAQTGVPFGDVAMVRDFLSIDEPVDRPPAEHPNRPVLGFGCGRPEVSGTRLWGWARDRFGTADAFFREFFVANYCPLVFMEESARNHTPDKLPGGERVPLFAACDEALRRIVSLLQPRAIVGVGGFAERRAREALSQFDGPIGCMVHPSPRKPEGEPRLGAMRRRGPADSRNCGERLAAVIHRIPDVDLRHGGSDIIETRLRPSERTFMFHV